MKFRCRYSCKNYFGSVDIEADSKDDAKIKLKAEHKLNDPTNGRRPNRLCGDKCKITIQVDKLHSPIKTNQ